MSQECPLFWTGWMEIEINYGNFNEKQSFIDSKYLLSYLFYLSKSWLLFGCFTLVYLIFIF